MCVCVFVYILIRVGCYDLFLLCDRIALLGVYKCVWVCISVMVMCVDMGWPGLVVYVCCVCDGVFYVLAHSQLVDPDQSQQNSKHQPS